MRTKLSAALTLVAPILLLTTGITAAGSKSGSLSDLGRPTKAIPPGNPMAEFRHIKLGLHSHGLPEVLFLGTLVDDGSAAERWPLVKALAQFGTFTGLQAASSLVCRLPSGVAPSTGVNCFDPGKVPGAPTYDFSHVRYASKYVALVGKDLIDRSLHVSSNLSPTETFLFNSFVRLPYYHTWNDAVWQTALGDTKQRSSGGRFPLLVVGSYLATGASVAIPGDLSAVNGPFGLPFSTVQQSLQQGKPIGTKTTGPPASLIRDFNAETNIITALICHLDGSRPAKVCSRSMIRRIVKDVK